MVPDIRQEDIERVSSVLKSGMLVQGKQVAELENKIAEYIGVKHAIAVSNGTASLHLTLLALNIGSGDEVIVPSFSFIATANVVELVGAKPIFADIDINTCNINTQKIENVITSRTKAIIPVHEFGLCCDIEEICQLAEKHKLHVIEDAACALGSSSTQGFAGSFGTAGSFSFHPRKAITSGEGGMIVTNYPELAARLRALRNHGIDPTNAKMDFIAAGYNYRLTDIQAALVLSQFERLGSILKRRDEISRIYFNELRNVSGILLPKVPVGKKHSWQSFHIIIEGTNARDTIINLSLIHI